MASDLVNIADGVKGILNAATLSQVFVAERTYSPEYDVTTQPGLKVFVVPMGQGISFATRSLADRVFSVGVGIYNTVGFDEYGVRDQASVDAMLQFAGEVIDLFLTTGDTNPDAVVVDVLNDVAFDPQALDQHNVFMTVVELKFKVIR